MLRSVFCIAIVVLCFQTYFCEECGLLNKPPGKLTFQERRSGYSYYRGDKKLCWVLRVPPKSVAILRFDKLEFSSSSCSDSYVQVAELGIAKSTKVSAFCSTTANLPVIVTFQDVYIQAFVHEQHSGAFTITYYTENSACYEDDLFYCSNTLCIPSHKVCDGIKDCEDGADEKSCKTGIFSVEGFDVSRDKASAWLERNMTDGSGWENNLHRGIVALYLSGKMDLSRNLSHHELMVKQLQIQTTMALLRNSTESLSINKLSMIVNSLLVVCQNPRNFYGFDMVQLLMDAIKNSEELINPVAYLALCNAHEPLPQDGIAQLIQILENATDAEYLFVSEIKAIAVMTLSCVLSNGQKAALNESDLEIYDDAVQQLKQLQHQRTDGSFGNVYTTALIVQALFSKGEENSTDWNLKDAVRYLMKELDSRDFLSTYMILPVLNRKNLADIANINCTGYPGYKKGNTVSDAAFNRGPKMRVQYSLYLGKNKDIIHTIYLTIPASSSAFDIMEIAAVADQKYKFQWKSMSGKVYVFEINGYVNDPEAGFFWLTYVTGSRLNDTLINYKTSKYFPLLRYYV